MSCKDNIVLTTASQVGLVHALRPWVAGRGMKAHKYRMTHTAEAEHSNTANKFRETFDRAVDE